MQQVILKPRRDALIVLALSLAFAFACSIIANPGENEVERACDFQLKIGEFRGHARTQHDFEARLVLNRPRDGEAGGFDLFESLVIRIEPTPVAFEAHIPQVRVPERRQADQPFSRIDFFADSAIPSNDGVLSNDVPEDGSPDTGNTTLMMFDHQWRHDDACTEGAEVFNHEFIFEPITSSTRRNFEASLVVELPTDFRDEHLRDSSGQIRPFEIRVMHTAPSNACLPEEERLECEADDSECVGRRAQQDTDCMPLLRPYAITRVHAERLSDFGENHVTPRFVDPSVTGLIEFIVLERGSATDQMRVNEVREVFRFEYDSLECPATEPAPGTERQACLSGEEVVLPLRAGENRNAVGRLGREYDIDWITETERVYPEAVDMGTEDMGADTGAEDMGADMGAEDMGADMGAEDMGADTGAEDMGAGTGAEDMGADTSAEDMGGDAA